MKDSFPAPSMLAQGSVKPYAKNSKAYWPTVGGSKKMKKDPRGHSPDTCNVTRINARQYHLVEA